MNSLQPSPVAHPEKPAPSTGTVVDRVVSWILVVLLVAAALVLGFFSVFSVFATDSCGTSSDDPAVCDTAYFSAVLFGYWALLAVLTVGTVVMAVLGTVRRRRIWPWALGGPVVMAGGTAVFIALMSR